MKRVQAEGEAHAATQRLAVAQQQFGEYLCERSATEDTLASQAQRVEDLLRAALMSSNDDPAATAALLSDVTRLRENLTQAALEVKSAATQMQAETERMMTKRTSVQADLENPSSDVDMKRARDHDATATEQQEQEQNEDEDEDICGGDEDDDELDIDADGTATTAPLMSEPPPPAAAAAAVVTHDSFRERAKYIPLRLTVEERRVLRLLEGALNVSDYTDKVDILSYKNKNARVHAQIKDLCAILCGLTVAQNFRRGQQLMGDRDFGQLEEFFQTCFEIGRRHKIMNPEKMRETYGKLCYMLMDSSEPDMIELLGFRCVKPLRTVAALLEEGGASAMLDDPLIAAATAEIQSAGRPRAAVQKDIKVKERAREVLARKYRTKGLGEEDLLRCLYSIADNNSFLAFSRDPVDRMIAYLKAYFRPDVGFCSLMILFVYCVEFLVFLLLQKIALITKSVNFDSFFFTFPFVIVFRVSSRACLWPFKAVLVVPV